MLNVAADEKDKITFDFIVLSIYKLSINFIVFVIASTQHPTPSLRAPRDFPYLIAESKHSLKQTTSGLLLLHSNGQAKESLSLTPLRLNRYGSTGQGLRDGRGGSRSWEGRI